MESKDLLLKKFCLGTAGVMILGSVAGCSSFFSGGLVEPTDSSRYETTQATTEATTETSAQTLGDMITGAMFRGNAYNRTDQVYTDVTTIDYLVGVTSGAEDMGFTYGYTVSIDDEIIASESGLPVTGTDIPVVVESDEAFPAGHLYIEVNDDNGQVLIVGECDIEQSPPYGGLYDVPVIDREEDGSFMLPYTNIRFTPYLECYTEQEFPPELINTRGFNITRSSTLFWGAYNDEGVYSACGYGLIYLGTHEYSVERAMLNQMELYDQYGIDYEMRTEDYELGGVTYPVYILQTIPEGDEPSVITYTIVVGEGEGTYLLSGMTPEPDAVEVFNACLSIDNGE